jgi:predicted RNA-binding protein YlqC (UPF0109 family)
MTVEIEASSKVQDLLLLIARSIVDEPEKVKIEAETSREETVMRLQVASTDLPAIIGTNGDMGDSLRNLLGNLSDKYKHPFALDIAAIN